MRRNAAAPKEQQTASWRADTPGTRCLCSFQTEAVARLSQRQSRWAREQMSMAVPGRPQGCKLKEERPDEARVWRIVAVTRTLEDPMSRAKMRLQPRGLALATLQTAGQDSVYIIQGNEKICIWKSPSFFVSGSFRDISIIDRFRAYRFAATFVRHQIGHIHIQHVGSLAQ